MSIFQYTQNRAQISVRATYSSQQIFGQTYYRTILKWKNHESTGSNLVRSSIFTVENLSSIGRIVRRPG